MFNKLTNVIINNHFQFITSSNLQRKNDGSIIIEISGGRESAALTSLNNNKNTDWFFWLFESMCEYYICRGKYWVHKFENGSITSKNCK